MMIFRLRRRNEAIGYPLFVNLLVYHSSDELQNGFDYK